MKVHLVIGREAGIVETVYWVEDATDEWTMDEWSGAYPTPIQEKLDKDPANRRILIVELPENAMELPFRDVKVQGEVVTE